MSKQLRCEINDIYSDDIPMHEHPKQHFCVWHPLECPIWISGLGSPDVLDFRSLISISELC